MTNSNRTPSPVVHTSANNGCGLYVVFYTGEVITFHDEYNSETSLHYFFKFSVLKERLTEELANG